MTGQICVQCGVDRPRVGAITLEVGPLGNVAAGVVCSVCAPPPAGAAS